MASSTLAFARSFLAISRNLAATALHGGAASPLPRQAPTSVLSTTSATTAETERSPEHRAKPEAPDPRSEGSAESDVRGGRMKSGVLAETGILAGHSIQGFSARCSSVSRKCSRDPIAIAAAGRVRARRGDPRRTGPRDRRLPNLGRCPLPHRGRASAATTAQAVQRGDVPGRGMARGLGVPLAGDPSHGAPQRDVLR
jgi:hypothetical protein